MIDWDSAILIGENQLLQQQQQQLTNIIQNLYNEKKMQLENDL